MLKVQSLSKAFAGRTIFHDVSLEVSPGEAVALMGPSGSGKTTLLRCLNGLDQPDAGTISIADVTLDSSLPPAAWHAAVLALRRRVGFVFQGWHLFSHRTVLDNVVEGPVQVRRLSKAAARERAIALLDQVGIGHRAGAWPHQLSGGEQQRAAIARALAMDPEVLLLDEPTSALDEARAGRLTDLLSELVGRGLALLTVTHDGPFGRRVAKRVFELEDGQLRRAP